MFKKLWQMMLVTVACFLFGASLVAAAEYNTSHIVQDSKIKLATDNQSTVLSPSNGPTTVITVNTTEDTANDTLTTTCGYDVGINNSASPCSFRRAIVEASYRPSEDRPIAIVFNLPLTDSNYNAANDTWTILIEDDLPGLSRENTLDTNGEVTIDADTQPGGRTDGPKIIMNTRGLGDVAGHSLTVESDDNIIRNFLWRGGGTIQLSGNNNTVEHIWMGLSDDGQEIALEDDDRPEGLAGGGIAVQQSEGNIIRNNAIVGSTGSAIRVQGDDNQISNNQIGTRADGTVPDLPEDIKCRRSTAYVEGLWYGGWGIWILGGSDNQVTNNRIVALHQTQSANDTAPIALQIGGDDTIVQNNIIGVDSADNEWGTCGGAIDINGQGSQITENLIVGSRSIFEEKQSDTALYASSTRFDGGGITMRDNIIRESTAKVINFSPASDDDLREFEPARITSLEGTSVMGTNGIFVDTQDNITTTSVCGNCTIDLYLDDLDQQQEAFELLTSVQADGDGNFTATLPRALTESEGIRIGSTTTAPFIIGNFIAGTSTKLSGLYLEPQALVISDTLPTEGEANQAFSFRFSLEPLDLAPPINYTIDATDFDTFSGTSNSTEIAVSLTWKTGGQKTINVRASTELGELTGSHQVQIDGPGITPTITPTNPPMTPTMTPTNPPMTPTMTPSNSPTPTMSKENSLYLPLVVR